VARTPQVRGALVALMMLVSAPSVLAGDGGAKSHPDSRNAGTTKCTMSFSLKGWSAFYKTAKGHGRITCDNGQTSTVRLKATGGGLTFGKTEIVDGTGRFTEARRIEELFGNYVQSEAHAGAGKSADAQALTKGEISLSLVGTGRGVDIGFAFGKFTITRN